eukprot:2427783-Heterocapsa_arctica.AAC.1
MGATFATLIDVGWEPRGPAEWLDTEGGKWALDPDSKPAIHTCAPLLDQLRQGIMKSLWCKAASARSGIGLDEVPNLP